MIVFIKKLAFFLKLLFIIPLLLYLICKWSLNFSLTERSFQVTFIFSSIKFVYNLFKIHSNYNVLDIKLRWLNLNKMLTKRISQKVFATRSFAQQQLKFAAPKKLREIMQMSLIEREPREKIEYIWNEYHRTKPYSLICKFQSWLKLIKNYIFYSYVNVLVKNKSNIFSFKENNYIHIRFLCLLVRAYKLRIM